MNNISQVVLFTNDKDADDLLISTLIKHKQKLAVVDDIDAIIKHLKDDTPKVILVSSEKFQDSLTIFYSALDKVPDKNICEHFFVSLVSRHDEGEAYDAYRNGIVDDYLVARPLYEIHRPILICEQLLTELGVAKREKPGLEHIYREEKYTDEVRTLLAKGLERKEQMKLELESSVYTIEAALDSAAEKIQRNQSVSLDIGKLQETLAKIKSDDIRPELLKLQSKAINLLQAIVQDSKDLFVSSEEGEQAAIAPVQAHNKLQETLTSSKTLDIPKAPKKVRVLLVEDDPISIHLTAEIIDSFNTELDTAFTGRRALACLKSNAYDLILIDINLPDTNGIYLLDQIKQAAKNKDAHAIMLTGNRQKKIALECINLGAKNYIVKPLRKENFLASCKKLNLPLTKKVK